MPLRGVVNPPGLGSHARPPDISPIAPRLTSQYFLYSDNLAARTCPPVYRLRADRLANQMGQAVVRTTYRCLTTAQLSEYAFLPVTNVS
ncbi:unnamed protein product [Protopolystoma xenopodis]|uniref:Uncharacterized protein n=1 Tax=Protopolystoma xenopodis TaxID=117903 RepID=A0A3S5BK91_9PLAT|nr:unnamed protein product [Protopolystoma xenopodis]